MSIEPNDLCLFAIVADRGSFSRAAEYLGLPKSTVSRRIARLENQLGERLLQRTTRKFALTEMGLALLDHARQVVDGVEAAAALAQHRQAQPSGVLRISMPNDFANLVLAPMLSGFVERYPKVSLEIDLSARRVDLLGEGFDIAIRFGNLPDDVSLTAKRIVTASWWLHAAPAYLRQRGEPRSPDDLMQHDALRLSRGRREIAPWLLMRGEQTWEGIPPGRVTANSPELLVRLACQGLGIVAMPDHYVRSYVDTGALTPVLPDWRLPTVTGWAVFAGRRLLPAKTRAFLEMLDALAGG
ncbi:MAG: LysR substrate-binding domain-containing protein [Methylococcus sp.]|nr:LysR substrate-binding domain-containing protein [Methylococcus sp.]